MKLRFRQHAHPSGSLAPHLITQSWLRRGPMQTGAAEVRVTLLVSLGSSHADANADRMQIEVPVACRWKCRFREACARVPLRARLSWKLRCPGHEPITEAGLNST